MPKNVQTPGSGKMPERRSEALILLFWNWTSHRGRSTLRPLYRITQLSKGLRVATAEMPQMVGVSVGLWVGIGSRYEPEELNGVCHFIEHLLFKGTKKRSAREISEEIGRASCRERV